MAWRYSLTKPMYLAEEIPKHPDLIKSHLQILTSLRRAMMRIA